LGTALGGVFTGSVTGAGDESSGSCGGSGTGDLSFAWTAPANGDYSIVAATRGDAVTVYARQDGCEGAEVTCGVGSTLVSATAGSRFVIFVDGSGAFALSIDLVLSSEAGLCGDEADNDGDGSTDCEDSDCAGDDACVAEPEDCTDGVDNDLDGLVDCNDPQCAAEPDCRFGGDEDCSNGEDDDGDGMIDCADPSCSTSFDCFRSEVCSNGVDDDGDSLIDCEDPSCGVRPICAGGEDCGNGVDDDGDGAVDCDDLECFIDFECFVFPFP
jgi:hypothetical protein